MPLLNTCPGPPAAVLSALLRGGLVTTDRRRLTWSNTSTVPPRLPSLDTDVVWMPGTGELDGNLTVTGMLVSQGWATGGVTTVTGAYTALPSDAVILANAVGGAFTVTLPDATQQGFSPGQRYTVIKTDSSANVVTVATSAGQLISGAATVSLTGSNGYTSVVFDGVITSNWWVESGFTTVGASPAGPAGGSLAGNYPNPTVPAADFAQRVFCV